MNLSDQQVADRMGRCFAENRCFISLLPLTDENTALVWHGPVGGEVPIQKRFLPNA